MKHGGNVTCVRKAYTGHRIVYIFLAGILDMDMYSYLSMVWRPPLVKLRVSFINVAMVSCVFCHMWCTHLHLWKSAFCFHISFEYYCHFIIPQINAFYFWIFVFYDGCLYSDIFGILKSYLQFVTLPSCITLVTAKISVNFFQIISLSQNVG